MNEKLRHSGIDFIGDVPWGTYFCQFYKTKEDLTDILVPYFKAGLENNEFCMWITSQPLNSEEAKEVLRKSVPDFDVYLEKGQIEIIPYTDWYEGVFVSERVLNVCVEKLNQALESSYEGVRCNWNTSWLKKEDLGNFVDYEKKADSVISNSHIIALCTYSLDIHDVTEIIDIVANHQFALVKKEENWERIENSGRKNLTEHEKTEEILLQNEQRARLKSESILSSDREKENPKLAEIIDARAIQSLMEDFFKLAHIPIGIIDLKGNVLVGVGWQDICTRFHRVHPETCKHCVESDIKLSSGVFPGEVKLYKLYRCKNNMWDIATPIIVGDHHVGYAFSGQFFFEGEPLDYELFRSQARKYGFNEEEYIAALERVPRLSREAVDICMSFLTTFANMVSQLGYSNIKLTRSLAERDSLVDALQESEKRERARSEELEAVLDAVPVTVFIAHDPQALQITGNRLSYEWVHAPVGTNFSKSAPEGERPEMFKLFKDGMEIQPANMPSQMAAAGREINDFELDIISSDGEIRHVLGNARPLRDEQGNSRGSVSAFIDITGRKKAEETIRLSNLYNRSLIEASLDPLVTIGRDGKITDVNGATEQVTGYSRNELIGTDFSDYFTEPEKARKSYQHVFTDGEVRDYPLEIRHKDGHVTPVLYNASVYRDENGEVIGVFAAARDITESKKVEEALQKSEAELARAQQISQIGSWTWDLITDELTWSEQSYRNYGLAPGEVKPSYELFLSFIVPEDRERVDREVQKAIESGHKYNVTYNIIRRDGMPRILLSENEIITDESGKVVLMYGTNQDVTERKRVEEALRESEERLRLLSDNLPDSAVYQYVLEPDGSIRFLYFSTGIERLNGVNVKDVLRDPSTLYRQVPQPYLERLFEAKARSVRELSDFEMEVPMRLPDGQVKWMRLHTRPRRIPDGRIIWNGVQTDITENKQAEEALKKAHENLEEKIKERTAELEKAYNSLKESERGLAEAQKMAHIGNWDNDLVIGELHWSEEMYRIFRLNPQEGITYDKFLSHVHPEDRDYVYNSTREAFDGKVYATDYRIVRPDGEERIVHSEREVIFDERNNPVRMRGTVQDITQHKKSEEKIRSLANIVESSNDAIGTMSLENIITSWNQEAEHVYGYSAEEILGKHTSILAPPHLDKETSKLCEMIKQGKKIRHHETSRLRKDGKIIDVSITLSPVFDSRGKLTAISFISRDITERKRVEEKLRESEEKYRNIVETANEGILIIDGEAIITYANKKMADMLGYTLEEGIGRPVWGFADEESKTILKQNLEKRRQGVNESYELKLICKDGSPLWALINAKSLFDKDGKFMGTVSMLTDITERKKAEEALKNIEIARKQEIHHRIKNNLQVISSLLDLQAEKFNNREDIKDSEVLEAFRESQDRVMSIALIHEELHEGEGDNTLYFSPYLEKLVENLFQTYSLGNADISLSLDLEDNIFFDMDTAVPLGIIVNELVSNSLKYAFPNRESGEIQIKLYEEEIVRKEITETKPGNNEKQTAGKGKGGTVYTLIISDNGVGIPKKIELENSDTLGLQLVNILVDQLDGVIELKRDSGTEFIIRINV